MFDRITKVTNGYSVVLDGEEMFIPNDPGNRHFKMVQEAIETGAVVNDQSVPPVDPKMVGVEFEGVMCSATALDQAGLAAVLLAIQLQGAAFQPTRFYFENGNTLVITLDNWQSFAAVWLPYRQSFFAVT